MDLEKETSKRWAGLTFNPDADRRSAVRPGKRSRSEPSPETEVQMGLMWALSIVGESGSDQVD